MSDRETFFPNDRPILVFEARRPSIERFDDPDGVPAQPTSASLRIFNGTTGTMVDLGGQTVVEDGPPNSLLYIAPKDEDNDKGALLYVTIPPQVADAPGNYTLYISTEYGDGLRITHDQKVQISEYR